MVMPINLSCLSLFLSVSLLVPQLVEMLDRMHTPDERLLVVLTCCARLTDAVEADDQNLFKDIEGAIDPLNLKRCLCVCVCVCALSSFASSALTV